MTFRAFTIGFSAALLALACGGEDSNNPETPLAPDPGTETSGGDEPSDNTENPVVDPPSSAPSAEECAANQFLAGCPDPATGEPEEPEVPVDGDDPIEAAKAFAENVLRSNCGQCHGTALDEEDVQAGMNFIDDIDRLVDEGYIIPLNSRESRIIERMVDGSMPPSFAGLDRVTQADIDTVSQFIDNPAYWDVPGGADCGEQELDFDDLFSEIQNDLAGEDDDDVINYRYVVLTNRFNAGVCADGALDRDRQGLIKMLNMLSTETTVEAPFVVDSDQTIYRIDLRDYNWDREVDVVIDGQVQSFADVWEAIVANNPYAVPFVGDDADDVVEDTGTLVPFMYSDSMIDVAMIGNLYYAIIDVDVNQNLDDFILNNLGIDVNENLDEEDLIRAGTTRSRISRQDRLVERHEIGVRAGVYWQSFDFADDQNESIFEDPFGFQEGGREAIFTLPNGLFGYIIADENGTIVEDSDILLDTNQNNFRAVTSVSCQTCHASGLIEVVDEVADFAIDNRLQIGLDNDELELLEEVYPSADEFLSIIEDDTNDFYRAALERLDLPTTGADPMAGVFLRFDKDMRISDAAGDLGVTVDFLEENLNELDPALEVLERGTLDRDDFTQFFVASLCVMNQFLDNTPDPAVCDAALAELEN